MTLASLSEAIFVRTTEDYSLVIGPAEPITINASLVDTTLIGPSPDEVIVINSPPLVVVEPPARGAWDERGWILSRENGHQVYVGFYQVIRISTRQQLRFGGRLVIKDREVTPYIADPPPEISRHPKNPCFTRTHGPWFRVHWYRSARNADDAILYVERILDEAINGR